MRTNKQSIDALDYKPAEQTAEQEAWFAPAFIVPSLKSVRIA
jgi:hypothetical protein